MRFSVFIWSALGDGSSSTTIRSNEVSHHNFSRADLDNAAKKAYSSAPARATDQQFHAVMHVLKEYQHAIAVPEGIYILLQLVCCMFGVNQLKCVVISLHNALLMQDTKHFLGTSLRVKRLLLSDVAAGEISSDFDLLFISIHGFKDKMDNNDTRISRISLLMSTTTFWANCFTTQTRGHLAITWQDKTSKSLYYQQRLTHCSWVLLIIILG